MHYPLPSSPGAIIGYRRNGTPIRLIAGGSGEGEGDTGNTDASTGNDGTASQQDVSGSDDSGTGTGNTRNDRGQSAGDDDGHTAKTVAAIRDEFKNERGKRQAAERELASVKAAQSKLQEALDADKAERAKQMDILAIAMGLKSGDEPPDPEKLAAELKTAQDKAQAEISQRDTAIRQSQVELAVLRNAGKHGGNGDALLDSRSFMNKVNGLDPSAGSFADDLAEAIKGAVESNPQYKAAAAADSGTGKPGGEGSGGRRPPARSSGEHTTPGGNRQWTREEAAAIAKSDPQALMKAINDGLLTDLGYQPQSRR